MPTPKDLEPLEILFGRGYFPSAPDIPPADFLGTIRRGSNVWIRSTGKPEVANGVLEVSATNVGARIFAADTDRVTFAGGLVGSRLPYAGVHRYQNSVLLFLSEITNGTVYVNESAATSTSPTAGRLRAAIPNGLGGYDTFDAGFDKPLFDNSYVAVATGAPGVLGARPFAGRIGVSRAPWRSKTNAIGPPGDVLYYNLAAEGSGYIQIAMANLPSGADGIIYCGTRLNDENGEIHIVRKVYKQPPGTFTATNGSALLTAGVDTQWNRDLREHDIIVIDGGSYEIATGGVTSNGTVTLKTNFTGSTNPGKTMTIEFAAASWYDSELGALVSRDVFRPPQAATIIKYAGRVILVGVPDTTGAPSSSATGNAIVPMLPSNPEHCDLSQGIGSQNGGNILNALGADGPLYLMTTNSLEIVTFTSDPAEPYKIKTIAEPGFKDPTAGLLDGDYFYGFNGMPFRTKASKNLDFEFAEPVHKIMKAWTGRVMLNTDPINKAVLWMHDDGASTVVLPYMTQLGVWGPELNFSARIIDSQVVNGKLYLTYLNGGNYRVQQWEGGAGIGGTRYIASQYVDPLLLARNRVKRLAFVGKAGTLRVYAAPLDGAVPDVSNPAAADVICTLSDTDKVEPEIGTNVHGKAYAFRIDFPSNDGKCDKLVVAGTRIGERR